MNDSTGIIQGIPAQAGRFEFTVQASDNSSPAVMDARAFQIEVIGTKTFAIETKDGIMGFKEGSFGFNITGPEGQIVVIDGSIDLENWFPLRTNVLGSEPFYFSDPQSSANPSRYYRVRTP